MSHEIPAEAVGLDAGSEAQAVRPVQAYLQDFGYLQDDHDPFEAEEIYLREATGDHVMEAPLAARSGVFDDSTAEALRHFQKFVGLEATGKLDQATVSKMNQPRCGNPDTKPAAETAALAEFVTGLGKWDTHNLTYSFQEFSTDLTENQIRWAIDQAFALWSAETRLRFRRLANGTAGDIVIRFVTGAHGDGSPFGSGSTALAHAFPPSTTGSFRGDAHFDDDRSWTLNIPTGTGFDLVTVAAHEFGHSLGLAHSADTSAMMAPIYAGPRRFLSRDDIQGIQSIYGGPGTLANATWIHGNAALVEHPAQIESQRYFGFYNRIVGKPSTTNWIHFALPTPVIADGQRLVLDRFMIRAATGANAVLRDVHIRDGERVVAVHQGVNRSGNLSLERFGVAAMPDVRWGVSVSLGFNFGSGNASSRRVDLISAGFDYK